MEGNSSREVHVLAFPFPCQGHINPMLQFCKRLSSKGLKTTLALTTFISNSIHPKSDVIKFETISDGFDEGSFGQAGDIRAYLECFQAVGSKTLAELIKRHQTSDNPIHCLVYDAFMPWALDVAKEFGLVGATFFYAALHCQLHILLHSLRPADTATALISSVHSGDAGTRTSGYAIFYLHVIDEISKVKPMMTIGPTIPSYYLDNRVKNDIDYGLNLFPFDASTCLPWLENKPSRSIVYVSFGSMASLSNEQMVEIAWGLKNSGFHFIMVIRGFDEAKLLENFKEGISDIGILVNWTPQLRVLADESIGCFFSHCGWNSTIEALSLGVPVVAMPQWTDQITNAKLVQDVWKVGIRVSADEKGIVGREEIEGCIREVMEGEKGQEMKRNAMKWKDLAKEAVAEGGTSDRDIDEFVSKLSTHVKKS